MVDYRKVFRARAMSHNTYGFPNDVACSPFVNTHTHTGEWEAGRVAENARVREERDVLAQETERLVAIKEEHVRITL